MLQTEPTRVENCTEDRIPKVGMKFCTEEEAYQFYNAYARDKGFSIRRSSSHNVKNTTTIKNRTFCCSRACTKLNYLILFLFMARGRTTF